MLDLHRTPGELLGPVAHVVEAALDTAEGLRPDQIMIVGAWCRDILHHALGHSFPTAATRDLDLALALSSWDAAGPVGVSGVRAPHEHPIIHTRQTRIGA